MNLKYNIIQFLIISIFLDGLIIAISKYIGFKLSFDPIGLISLIYAPYMLFKLIHILNNKIITIRLFILLILVFSVLIFAKLMFFPLETSVQNITITMFYITGILLVLLPYGLDAEQTMKIFKLVVRLGLVLLVIAYIQRLYHDVLPDVFTEIPLINSSDIRMNYERTIGEIFIFQPNGLYDNPIVFGSMLLLIFSLQYHFLLQEKSIFDLISLIFLAIMIFLLFSRANFISMLVIILFPLFNRHNIKYIYILFLFVLLMIIFISFTEENVLLSYMIDRLTGNDDWAQASNAEHLSDYIVFYNIITENLLLGIPVGKNFIENYITDGAWFSFILDFGLLLFTIFLAIWLLLLRFSFKVQKATEYRYLVFPFLFMISLTGFFNSFLMEKKSFMLIWIIAGLMLNLYNIQYSNSINKKL